MFETSVRSQQIRRVGTAESTSNCGSGTSHGTVSRFSQGQRLMVPSFLHSVFLLFLAVCAVQLMGTAYSEEGLRQWAAGPPHAQDQLPGTQDGQTNTDQGESEVEELALTQADAFRPDPLIRTGIQECASWCQTDFASDLFRPPTRS